MAQTVERSGVDFWFSDKSGGCTLNWMEIDKQLRSVSRLFKGKWWLGNYLFYENVQWLKMVIGNELGYLLKKK